MNVREVMTSAVVTCAAETNAGDAVRAMWEQDLGFVPVVDRASRKVLGVVTDRDACMGAFTQGRTLHHVAIQSCMGKAVHGIGPDATLSQALATMADKQVRRLPVIDQKGQLLGLITLGGIARAAADAKDRALLAEVGATLARVCTPPKVAAGRAPEARSATEAAKILPASPPPKNRDAGPTQTRKRPRTKA